MKDLKLFELHVAEVFIMISNANIIGKGDNPWACKGVLRPPPPPPSKGVE